MSCLSRTVGRNWGSIELNHLGQLDGVTLKGWVRIKFRFQVMAEVKVQKMCTRGKNSGYVQSL